MRGVVPTVLYDQFLLMSPCYINATVYHGCLYHFSAGHWTKSMTRKEWGTLKHLAPWLFPGLTWKNMSKKECQAVLRVWTSSQSFFCHLLTQPHQTSAFQNQRWAQSFSQGDASSHCWCFLLEGAQPCHHPASGYVFMHSGRNEEWRVVSEQWTHLTSCIFLWGENKGSGLSCPGRQGFRFEKS